MSVRRLTLNKHSTSVKKVGFHRTLECISHISLLSVYLKQSGPHPSALETITNSPRKLAPTSEATKRRRVAGAQRSLSLKKSPQQPSKTSQMAVGSAQDKEENCQIQ